MIGRSSDSEIAPTRSHLFLGESVRSSVVNPREDIVNTVNILLEKRSVGIDDVVLKTVIGLQLFQTFDRLSFPLNSWVHTVSLRLYLNDVEFTAVLDNHKIWEIAVVIVVNTFVFKVEIRLFRIRQAAGKQKHLYVFYRCI